MEESNWWQARMKAALDRRREKGTLRRLHAAAASDSSANAGKASRPHPKARIDFSSNDYLGLAHDPDQHARVEAAYQTLVSPDAASLLPRLGATGSRLLSGDSAVFHELEDHLAILHNRQAALVCNSGYDANLAVVSSLSCDCIVYDEYAHNSLHMGMRLWQSQDSASDNNNNKKKKQVVPFQHNSTRDLQRQLARLQQSAKGSGDKAMRIMVLIESIYSMDGDEAPVRDMLEVAEKYSAQVVVDEAHSLGVYGATASPGGTGVLAMQGVEAHPALACSIHTFGKAAGCHGAVVCGSRVFCDYMINYAYPIVYSTALPLHSLVTIRCAYDTMTGTRGNVLRDTVFRLIERFRRGLDTFLTSCHNISLIPSTSPIQALMIPGNQACSDFCQRLHVKSSRQIQLFPIKSPTVPVGQERVRIIIHSHNTLNQVDMLVRLIQSTLRDMGLSTGPSRL